MRADWMLVVVMVVVMVVAAGGKRRHHKPGRALLDRLVSTTVADAGASYRDAGGATLPAPLDAAPFATVLANATCGEAGAEDFCREMPAKRGVVCDVCEGEEGAAGRRHPASHALDGDPSTWWQSPTLAAADRYQDVALVVTLPDEMELLHVIIKTGPSPRPLAWSLETSPTPDEDDWRLIRAFGDKDHCRRLWSLRPERRRRKVKREKKRSHREDKPTCSTQFSSPRPLENGEMHVGLGEGVVSRRVRISLRASHAGPPERRYYSVRALTLAARCVCHGHAHACTVTKEGTRCDCRDGSCGAHCEQCCGDTRGGDAGRGCRETDNCSYDDSGALLCVNCTDNRAGPLCNRCLEGYYSVEPDSPCLPCSCFPPGSDGTCEWRREDREVSCRCKEGFTGPMCDVCADLGAQLPDCQVLAMVTVPACKCDPRGIVEGADVCDDHCRCKANVIGVRCDACAAGHYGLSSELEPGCRRCYCSGITDQCSAHPDLVDTMALSLVSGAWLVQGLVGNNSVEPMQDDTGKPYFASYEIEDWEDYYWVSQEFTGDQIAAYGSMLQYAVFWDVVRGDSGGEPTQGPDVVLVGRDGTQLAFGDSVHGIPGHTEINVPFMEGVWYQMASDGSFKGDMVPRETFLSILSDVRMLMLRARFHLDQDEVRLNRANFIGAEVGVREQCTCPLGYEGASCTRCSWTHVRVEHAALAWPRFECVACACNGHAGCDAETGECGLCQHNTTGSHCERCMTGHYGNPVLGPCRPCACPLLEPTNNFSPNCALAAATGDDFVCTQCPEGYIGDHCESCDFGYWGSPSTASSSCQPCACGGAACDRDTGQCIQCAAHAEGARCDQCEEGYWFLEGECVSCSCGEGALSAACDVHAGSCACRAGWRGRACNLCAPGHGDVAAGCPACHCGLAALPAVCDAVSGSCQCAPGASPPYCDSCLPEYYELATTGCTGCNCSNLGAEGNTCNIRSGQCRCKEHVTGRACDICEEGYWGLSLGGCRRCSCGEGAVSCDPDTGACACSPGVDGARCDRCLPGYYGLGPGGCLPCPACAAGQVCSPLNGRCECPARTLGATCSICAAGAWGLEQGGCRACDCGPGALSGECDLVSGACRCRAGWAGRACDVCLPGHHGPRCRPCACHVAGTADCDPDSGLCPCDQEGRCNCKENVVGPKCSECREGTFGLSGDNPSGCTACFCFGRSVHCTQAGLTRASIHAPGHNLTLTFSTATHNQMSDPFTLKAIQMNTQNTTIPMPRPPVPVYLEVGDQFLGDRVTSYGGFIRYTVVEDGGEEINDDNVRRHPLVRMYAGEDLVLDYFELVPPMNNTYTVRFHESLWKVRAGRGAWGRASRPALMVALRDVTRLLLRINKLGPARHSPVHVQLGDISLDTTVPGGGRLAGAAGVEHCECPRGYAAPSCHLPAPGFWMPSQRLHVAHVAGTIVISVDGEAAPCHCQGRAAACDPLTGHCLNCTEGTGGPDCGRCAEGYHGAPTQAGGCQACPCPERTRNFAAACELRDGRLQCLCKSGYTGSECESCAVGWVRAGRGDCRLCGCDPRGASGPACDARGRCRCRPHAAGPRCDQCRASRTYLENDYCRSCDNCTQTLLDSIELLTLELHTHAGKADLNSIPQPYPALAHLNSNASSLQAAIASFAATVTPTTKLNDNVIEDLENGMQSILDEAEFLRTLSIKEQEKSLSLSLEGMSGLEEVLNEKAKIGGVVETLDDFARGQRHLTAHRALKEAHHILRNIKDVRLFDYIAGATDVFDSANLQSTAINEYSYQIDDSMRRLRNLQFSLEQLHTRADEASKLVDTVWDAGDTVAALAAKTKPRLAAVRDLYLRTRLVLEDVNTLASHNLTEEAKAACDRIQLLAADIPVISAELEVLTLAAEEKEGIMYNLTPVYRQKYLDAAVKHVQELKEKANHYKSLFAGSLSAATGSMDAARAWADVAETITGAGVQAAAARAAAREAHQLTRGARPMVTRADNAKNISHYQKTRAEELLKTADELRIELEKHRRGAERVEVALRGLGWKERELAARPQATVAHMLGEANDVSDRVFGTTRVLYDEASELRRRVQYQLRRQLGDLQKHGDTALGAAQELVSQIRGNSLRGREVVGALADAASARAREHDAADVTLSPRMAQLRDNIARARHAAETISVSLSSAKNSVGCSRAYHISTSSSSITRISLALSFDGEVRDGHLLWLGTVGLGESTQGKSYLKLLVEDRKLKLIWNLGAGEAAIDHPSTLEPAHDDSDHTSYRIEIERIWNTVHLSLERAGKSNPVLASNSSRESAVSFRAPVELWLGSPGAASGGLPGCIHALYYDDRRIGLWNFVKQPALARCTGCTQRWYSSNPRGREPSLVWFNGAGYVELQRSELRPYDKKLFTVSLTFRTRDEDALLFMAVDIARNRSISVFLRACRVVFRVEYSLSTLEIVAGGRHCLGRPVHVQAIRLFHKDKLEKGSLRVNGEETLGSPEPPVQDAAALPDLATARYWVGGVPPGGVSHRTRRPLLGCIGALLADREGYDLLDTPRRHGVEPSCTTRVLRSMLVDGAGWVEMSTPALRRRSSLGVTFRTLAPTGLILLRAPSSLIPRNEVDDDEDEDHNYLMLLLRNGHLELSAATGKSSVEMRSNGTQYDDGNLHTVRVLRAHKQLELWVDEELVASGALSGGGLASRVRGLYLGGLPQHLNTSVLPSLRNVTGFVGTITDLIVNATLHGLEEAVFYQGAVLGRDDALAADRSPPPPELTQPPAKDTHCTKASSYTLEPGAVKFGDAPHSYATLKMATKALKQLSLAIQFRTFRQDGLLLLIPGSKAKPKHYLALILREGRLHLIVRGRKRREVTLPGTMTAGRWKAVSVRAGGGARLVLASGGVAAAARAPALLGLAARVYVAGLPERNALPNLPDSIFRVGGLVGCVRRVVLSGRAEDLVRSAHSHHRVGQCFPDVEQAAHFSGDAYATWSSSWSIDMDSSLEMTLQFRTAEPDGLLVAAAHFLLEIRDGTVTLSRRSPSGSEQSSVEVTAPGGGSVCDDRWHVVSARVSGGGLQVALDAGPPARSDHGPIQAQYDKQHTPLYIAGLPEGEESFGSKHNFKGCLRDVMVAGQKRDWGQLDAVHNVLLDSCPVQST